RGEMIDRYLSRAWPLRRVGAWTRPGWLRLRTVVSRRPGSRQYDPILALPASLRDSVLAVQDLTAISMNPLGGRVRPGQVLQDLLGDLGLAGAVHLQREVVDQCPGVVRRVPHGRHAGAVLGCGRFEQRPEDRNLEVGRNQRREHITLV